MDVNGSSLKPFPPQVDGGRFPAKRTLGDLVRVEADIFTDGHDSVAASLLYRSEKTDEWSEQRFELINNDRWFAEFTVTELGRYLLQGHRLGRSL